MKPLPDLQILFDDDQLIAIAKPADLAAIPGRAETDSVLERLARQIGLPSAGVADPRLRVVHRLDKDTTGVMLFAKNISAQRHVSQQFQNNQVHKEYLAIVSGKPREPEGEIDRPIAPHPAHKDRMICSKTGRAARTLYRLERKLGRFTLVRCFPQTGRTHQIRVHLASVSLPLAVDPLYHPPRPGAPAGIFLSHFKRDYRPTRGENERPLIARLTLHAERIRLTHPNGAELNIECPWPKDFRATVTQLGKL